MKGVVGVKKEIIEKKTGIVKIEKEKFIFVGKIPTEAMEEIEELLNKTSKTVLKNETGTRYEGVDILIDSERALSFFHGGYKEMGEIIREISDRYETPWFNEEIFQTGEILLDSWGNLFIKTYL